MKKRVAALLFMFVLTFSVAVPVSVFAAEDLVIDNAQLLYADELTELNALASEVTEKYQCDVRVYTTWDIEGMDPFEYSQKIYTENGFGYGEEKSGVMLMVSMADRDYTILAYGYGNTAFTDYGKEELKGWFLEDLSDGDYYNSFYWFITKSGDYLEMARNGQPLDVGNDPADEQAEMLVKILIAIGAPLLIALIFCLISLRGMKSAIIQREADAYIPNHGLELTYNQDTFINRTEVVTKIEKNESGGGSGGTTINSSGFSGSSGKF